MLIIKHRPHEIIITTSKVDGKIAENTVKLPIISPGLIFVQKAFFLGLFSGELTFRGACYRKKFCFSKWVGLDNKTATSNRQWAYIREGLLSEGYLRQRFGGLIFGRAYFWVGLLSEFYGMVWK